MKEGAKTSLISIIIPIYNGASFIKTAYSVIINQKIEHFELIFVNNNSTDDSEVIIQSIQEQDSRVFLYHEAVQGAAAARNTGLKYAKGDYIYFFDVDDELFNNALKTLYSLLESNPLLDSVFGNTIKSTSNLKNTQISEQETLNFVVHKAPYYGVRWMNYSMLPGISSFLHRKNVFKKVGKFNTELLLGEDAAFHVKLGMMCDIGCIDKHVLLYFRHSASTVSKQNRLQPKEFTYWEPLVKEHLPFLLLNQVPLQFKTEVFKRVYGYLPKMLALTHGVKNRFKLKKKLKREILPLHLPWLLQPFIWITALTGSLNFYKFYFFYILNVYMKTIKNGS
ncbi:glycosyltransferase family 2 protein [Mangrovimonas spongiae]|uniref:Glycosyltransferase family 2 protein n=1 Tax=Mangrovimonas spongiae TaxID=2494697 RepID=A0A428K246_9FLAO|nr:glycosyltransferase family 2 protein [Mangrovimonas spongiae]RSK40499.1 glycosyltransferase family 2 protein [Mangrovimonas spongiae]